MEIFILVVTVFYVALKCLIDMSQIVFINNYKMTNDEINKLELNANDYNKALDYNKSKLFLSLCKLVIEALVIYTFIISNGLFKINFHSFICYATNLKVIQCPDLHVLK